MEYVRNNPKAFFDAELLHIWTLDAAPYVDEKFKSNFRLNSFFIGDTTRNAINKGEADYTPVFLSRLPDLFDRKVVPIDVALIQTSLPDEHGYLNLGVSVDIVKSAVENASIIIAQLNSNMPCVHGDGFIHITDIDFAIPHDEPLPEYDPREDSEIVVQIGKYVAQLVQDGDTIQVGFGSIPYAILSNLDSKKHLGVHSELLTDGIVELMKKGVIDNSKKSLNKGKTIASYCMGKKETYEYINNNPTIELKRIDYTNNLMVIAQHENMTAINTALEIDLTGQASAESTGEGFYSGIGGFANFMRAAVLAKKGKTILAMKSTAKNGEISRIVPYLQEGTGVSLHRGDVQYVVTEYGIAYLHGKNIRERAMELISIAHPKFRSWLIEEAKKRNLIYKDQVFTPGQKGQYIKEFERYRTTKAGLDILLRPIKISDEPLLKDFFNSLSDNSLYYRFFTFRLDMPHERLQEFISIDNTKGLSIVAVIPQLDRLKVVGLGQYIINQTGYSAEVSFSTGDDYQNQGITTILLTHLIYLAQKSGLLSFTATVLVDNKPMLHVLKKIGFKHEFTEDGYSQFTKIF
jgi:acyl-CoA hydrolase/RimJ/RimL family protein N-acetyltransferase